MPFLSHMLFRCGLTRKRPAASLALVAGSPVLEGLHVLVRCIL
jgi:hypothetical protein